MRVLHAPDVVGGHAPTLARAERSLGLDSRCVALRDNVFQYGADEVLTPVDGSVLRRDLARLALYRRAMRAFDTIHFNFGQTFTPSWSAPDFGRRIQPRSRLARFAEDAYWALVKRVEMRELARLDRAGKTIAVTFQGDDARQGDFCLANFDITHAKVVPTGYYSPGSDAHKRWRIAQFDAHADIIYALNPDLLHVLPGRAAFLPYASVDPREWIPTPCEGDHVPRVLHAPTHRAVKGTAHILQALDELRAEGVEHELVLIENLTRAEARKAYESADLVVDQLLAGWYGGLAVEAMALGKPVIAYLREKDLRFLPSEMRDEMPVVNATPATIKSVLGDLLTKRRAELPELGRRSRAFVERWHDPRRIAERTRADYERRGADPGEASSGIPR